MTGRIIPSLSNMSIALSLETVNMLGYIVRGIKVTEVIKVAKQLTLKHLGELNVTVRVLINGRGRQKESEDGSIRRTPPCKRRKTAMSQEMWVVSGSW